MQPTPDFTVWHVTFGTYGTRLHGGDLPSVDRQHNVPGFKFLGPDPAREAWQRGQLLAPPLYLTTQQRLHIESTIPDLCVRGGWDYRIAAAPTDADHVHALIAATADRHGADIRRWLKTWLTQSLNARFGKPPERWWAEGGSNKPVYDASYYDNAYDYIGKQRTTTT